VPQDSNILGGYRFADIGHSPVFVLEVCWLVFWAIKRPPGFVVGRKASQWVYPRLLNDEGKN
jgi:hypothetical protein